MRSSPTTNLGKGECVPQMQQAVHVRIREIPEELLPRRLPARISVCGRLEDLVLLPLGLHVLLDLKQQVATRVAARSLLKDEDGEIIMIGRNK